MSVRATDRLIGDIVIVSALPKSPEMVVQAVEKEANLIITAWFSNGGEYQEGAFPASSLDRVEQKKPAAAKKQAPKKPAAAKPKKR